MLSLISALALVTTPTTVTVDVTTYSPEGTVYVQLCDRTHFLTSECPHSQRAEAEAQTQFVFEGVEPGEWAVSVWRDPEGDGVMARGMYNIPLEPTAISRNPPMSFGPPQFDDAKLDIGPQPFRFAIEIE